MEKDRKIKTVAVAAVLVAIIGLSIAFAALSQTLTINGTAKQEKSTWQVVWEKISGENFVTTGTVEVQTGFPKLDNDTSKTTGVDLSLGTITLKKPGDKVTYRVNMANNGDIDAKVTGVTGVSLDNTYVDYSVKYLDNNTDITQANGRLLAAGEKKLVLIEIKFKESVTTEQFNAIPSEGITVDFNQVSISYTQDDGTGVADAQEPACVSTAPEGAVKLGNTDEEFYKLWETNDEIAYLAKYNLIYGKKVVEYNGEHGTFEKNGSNNDVMYSQARQGSTCGSESRGAAMDIEGAMAAMQEDEHADLSSYIYTPWYATAFASGSDSGYWYDSTNYTLLSAYLNKYNSIHTGGIAKAATNENGFPVYVFDNNSSIYNIVQQYGAYLSQNGVNVLESRLMTYEEALSKGCNASEHTCSSAPAWITYTSYWLGSAGDGDGVWDVDSSGAFDDRDFGDDAVLGVRPVIVVSK